MRLALPACLLPLLGLLLFLGWPFAPAALAQAKNPKHPKTKFAQVHIHKNSKHCGRNYRIQVYALKVVEAPAALKPLLETQLQNWLRWALEAETSSSSSPEVWAKEELERYEKQDCEADKESAQTPWERTLTVKHFFEDERFLTLSFEFFAFEGGAHENRQRRFLTWDKETHTTLSLAALTPDTEALFKLAEEEFRKKRNLKPEESLEDSGYWFEKGQFRLSEQFAFTECGLLLYYNPYEVAAYAVGPIEVFLPFAKLKALFSLPLPSKPLVKAFEFCPNAPAPAPAPRPAPKPRAKTPS